MQTVASLTRRTQILLDEQRYRRLEREAAGAGTSVAALIRDAIDRTYPDDEPDRARAAAEFLREARADPQPVEDWAELKREVRDELAGVSRDAG